MTSRPKRRDSKTGTVTVRFWPVEGESKKTGAKRIETFALITRAVTDEGKVFSFGRIDDSQLGFA